jgi:hypothetical protein
MCISVERALRRNSPFRTLNSAGAASLYLWGNGAPERSSSELLKRTTLEQNAPRENPAPERNPGLKSTWIALKKKSSLRYMNFKFKKVISVIWKFFKLQIYPSKPQEGLPKSRENKAVHVFEKYGLLYNQIERRSI